MCSRPGGMAGAKKARQRTKILSLPRKGRCFSDSGAGVVNALKTWRGPPAGSVDLRVDVLPQTDTLVTLPQGPVRLRPGGADHPQPGLPCHRPPPARR
jgi:hypothetical protein